MGALKLGGMTRGITLWDGRAANGTTMCQEVSADGSVGWVNEVPLEVELEIRKAKLVIERSGLSDTVSPNPLTNSNRQRNRLRQVSQIRVYDDAVNMIETHEHAGDFKE